MSTRTNKPVPPAMSNSLSDQSKNEFMKELQLVSNSYGVTDIFRDACRMFAIALHQAFVLNKEEHDMYEREYTSYAKKYGEKGVEHISKCFAILTQALELRREDFLGHILEELNATTKSFGQYFTPTSVSRMMARCSFGDQKPIPGKIVRLNDPACGAGVLLLEGAEAFIRNGGRQCDLLILGEDLDFNAFNIAYVQFSLLGYAARVTRMDSLSMRVFEGPWYTVGYFAHAFPMRTRCGRIFGNSESAVGDRTDSASPEPQTHETPQEPQEQQEPKPVSAESAAPAAINVRELVQGELF